MSDEIPLSWLQTRLPTASVDSILAHEVERLSGRFEVPRTKLAALVSKRPTERYSTFLKDFSEDDALWSFSSPEEFWKNLCGIAGYAIVRGQRVVAFLVTVRN